MLSGCAYAMKDLLLNVAKIFSLKSFFSVAIASCDSLLNFFLAAVMLFSLAMPNHFYRYHYYIQ